jgi:hypothetical protein
VCTVSRSDFDIVPVKKGKVDGIRSSGRIRLFPLLSASSSVILTVTHSLVSLNNPFIDFTLCSLTECITAFRCSWVIGEKVHWMTFAGFLLTRFLSMR